MIKGVWLTEYSDEKEEEVFSFTNEEPQSIISWIATLSGICLRTSVLECEGYVRCEGCVRGNMKYEGCVTSEGCVRCEGCVRGNMKYKGCVTSKGCVCKEVSHLLIHFSSLNL